MDTNILKRTQRFYNVDFFRFIFAMMIVFYHVKSEMGNKILGDYIHGLLHWYICVDFFFIIAGFFLFNTINTAQSTFKFAKKKFLRLAPLLYFLLLCLLLSNLLFGTMFSFDGNLIKLFLLQNIGFAPGVPTGIPWFISVLFWVSLFYFYIAKIMDKKYLNLFMWIITVCSLGLVLNWKNFEIDAHTDNICYFINTGIVRGLAGIGIGYFVSMLYKSGFLQNNSKKTNLIITGIEIFCIVFLTNYLFFTNKLPGRSAFLYILFFSILFYLLLINKGLISRLLNQKFLGFLGSYSYAIYVMQPLFLMIFSKYVLINSNIFFTNHPHLCGVITGICCIISGVIAHYIFEKPVNKYLKKKY